MHKNEALLEGLKKLTVEEVRARDGEKVTVIADKTRYSYPIAECTVILDNGEIYLKLDDGLWWTEKAIYIGMIEIWGEEKKYDSLPF